MKNCLYILILLTTNVFGQKYFTIEGVVIDEENQAVPYATVFLKALNKGTSTTDDGRFVIEDVPIGKNYELVISSVGYHEQTLLVHEEKAQLPIDIILKKAFTELAAITVTPGAYDFRENRALNTLLLSKKQIDNLPNFVNDVFRTISSVPSVASTDYSIRPVIRGGNFRETGIYLDGLELLNPFHLEIGGGVQSLINTDFIQEVKILPGNFSTRYTDKTSGIIEMKTKNHFSENEYSFSLDLLNVIGAAKINLGEKLKFQTSLRRGYWDFLVDLDALGVDVSFYDSWNKLYFQPNEKHSLDVNFLYGKDKFDYTSEEQNTEIYQHHSEYDKLYAWANWKAYFSPSFYKHTTIGFQRLKKSSDFKFESSFSDDNRDDSDFSMFSLDQRFEWELSENGHLTFGGEYRYIGNKIAFNETRIDVHSPPVSGLVLDTIGVNTDLKNHLFGVYAEYVHRLNKLDVQLGVRLSGQDFSSGNNVAPRLNLRYHFSDKLQASLAYGWFYQPDYYFDIKSEFGQLALNSENMEAIHYGANLTWQFNKSSLQVDAYFKQYNNLIDDFRLLPTDRIEIFNTFERSFNAVAAESYGLELSFNQAYNKGTFNIIYAFGEHKIENMAGERTFRSSHIPHRFSVNNLLEFGNNINLSTTFQIRSGLPYSEMLQTGGLPTNEGLSSIIFYNLGTINNQRLPNYSSLDVRFSKKWLKSWGSMELYLNLLNALNRDNIKNYYYFGNVDASGQVNVRSDYASFFPIFITPGFSVKF